MKKKVRDSNVELLRILATIGVVVLHINGHVGGVLQKIEMQSIEGVILFFLEIVSAVAVNVFLLIFGYYQVEIPKIRYVKAIHLITYVVVYRLLLYAIEIIIGVEKFSIFNFISRFIPLNYYVVLYCVVYILSPYINLFLKELSAQMLKTFVFTLFLLFSVEAYIVDFAEGITGYQFVGLSSIGAEGGQDGYTIVNFILLYIIGAYLRICESEIKQKIPTRKIYLLQILCWGILFTWLYGATLFGVGGSILNYSNPILIVSSVASFLIFKYKKPKENKIINELAKAAFTVYLTHSLFVEVFVKYLHTDSSIIILECLVLSVLTYGGGYILYKTVGCLVDKICSLETKMFSLKSKI